LKNAGLKPGPYKGEGESSPAPASESRRHQGGIRRKGGQPGGGGRRIQDGKNQTPEYAGEAGSGLGKWNPACGRDLSRRAKMGFKLAFSSGYTGEFADKEHGGDRAVARLSARECS